MRLLPWDELHLRRALALAEDAAAFASPNPTVGCVLTRQDLVLGEGAHHYDDRDHAEIVALKAARAAGVDLQKATAYVTLEPCSHHGRTGPCADALIEAGISRCVIATTDPNPLVSGGGLARLAAAGVTVDLLEPSHDLAQQARRLNDAFAFSVQHGRPFVTLKAAISRDGKLAPHAAKRVSKSPFWLTGFAAREDVQRFRHTSDAILTGVGTVLADNPSMTDRTGLPRRRPLLRVVLDAALRTPNKSRLVQSAQDDVLVLTSETAMLERREDLVKKGIEVIRLPSKEGELDLDSILGTLAAVPVRSVLVEAGPALTRSLLQRQLVDRLVLYTAPVELGPDALPFAPGIDLETLFLQLTSKTEVSFPNGEAFDRRLVGYLHDPWRNI